MATNTDSDGTSQHDAGIYRSNAQCQCSQLDPLKKLWEKHRFEMKLVNPANKRKVQYHCGWFRFGRRVRLCDDGGVGVQCQMFLLPR